MSLRGTLTLAGIVLAAAAALVAPAGLWHAAVSLVRWHGARKYRRMRREIDGGQR